MTSFVTTLHDAGNGRLLAEGVLSDEKALNALSHEMAAAMLAALAAWREDERVVAVLLRGAGDKHFCAGGNIRAITQKIRAQQWDEVTAFFQDEYVLDNVVRCYPKPIVGWATGATMGGGMGVFQGCAVRVVTDTLKMAMPEVHIGLFPDVGASWFLRRCPPPLGLFLGLSGATLQADEALFARLADVAVPAAPTAREDFTARLLEALAAAPVTAADIKKVADEFALPLSPDETRVAGAMPAIGDCLASGNAAGSVADILAAMAQSSHPWLRELAARCATASPAAMVFWHRHYQSLQNASPAEALAADYQAMMGFARDPQSEFVEGVRALVIDKDKSPRWQHADCRAVPAGWSPPVHEDDVAAAAAMLKSFHAIAPTC